uniref:ATP-dependent DNA helicase 2 subunit 1 n=1 Tax=Caenorhabditis japonica TaxID=281687 RepID=A0A8R1I635_CAEJA
MDTTQYGDDDDFNENVNKKYTFFVIDGNPAMFETSKAGDQPEFKIALKLILNEMVRVCCSRSLNNHIGVIITSTKHSETVSLENSTLLVPMGVLGQEEVNAVKDLLEEEDVLPAVRLLTGGHHQSDLSNVLNYCKRVFASCPNTRHQSVVYLTNNRNPFGRDDFWESSYFKRTKTAVTKIIGLGQRKTLGEFSVIMLPEDGYKPEDKKEKQKEPWYYLDPEVFTQECDAAARIHQKITAQRSHANLTVNIGPGVTFDVSVFSMVMEAKPLDHRTKYTYDTEEKIVKTSGYVKKKSKINLDDEFEEKDEEETVPMETGETSIDTQQDEAQNALSRLKLATSLQRRDLQKAITIGGQKIILNRERFDAMNEVDAKGVDVVGFVPLNRVDREVSVISPKIIQPNDQVNLFLSSLEPLIVLDQRRYDKDAKTHSDLKMTLVWDRDNSSLAHLHSHNVRYWIDELFSYSIIHTLIKSK